MLRDAGVELMQGVCISGFLIFGFLLLERRAERRGMKGLHPATAGGSVMQGPSVCELLQSYL
jgi:hypothetical protein